MIQLALRLLFLVLLAPFASLSLGAEDARDYFADAGVGAIKEGEVRVWSSQVTCSGGASVTGSELIEYQPCYRLPSKYEIHKHYQWIKSRLPTEQALEIRNAAIGIIDLNGQHLECGQYLDGSLVLIEARLNGVHILLSANNPDDTGSDACRRIGTLESLLWKAAHKRTP